MKRSKARLGNLIVINEWNLSSIFNLIYKQSPISRIELTKIIRCSACKVSNRAISPIKRALWLKLNTGGMKNERK
jgi:hypothetical protein